MKQHIIKFLTVITIIFSTILSSNAQELKILVTITPLYSLVANVSNNFNKIDLLIDPNASPHHYHLKPSDVKKIQDADVIFAVGKNFEEFLFSNLSEDELGKIIPLADTDALKLLPVRNQKDDLNIDLHFWGSPHNARVIATKVATVLSEFNPENKDNYLANATTTIEKIDEMDKKIKSILAPVQHEKFVVSHDGYQYFEEYYGLHNVGTLDIHHGRYGAKTVERISEIIKNEKVKCIFSEPQDSSNAVQKIAENTGTKVGFLDIEGEGLSGKTKPQDSYFVMMEDNAKNFSACFKK